MRISDWSSDVCSSDLATVNGRHILSQPEAHPHPESDALPLSFPPCPPVRFAPVNPAQNDAPTHYDQHGHADQIGSASCRERVCTYWSISLVAVSLKKKNIITPTSTYSLPNKQL